MSALETAASTVPPFAIVLLAAVLAPFLPRIASYAVGALTTLSVAAIALLAPSGSYWQLTVFGVFDVVLFDVNAFSTALAFVFGALGTAAVVYAYHSEFSRLALAFALSYVAATFGMLFAGDWLTLLIFWELMAVTSTVLVWHYGGDAVRAGYRYAIAHGIGGSLLLFAVAWHFAETGTFLFPEGEIGSIAEGPALYLAVVGIGINCGFIFLHTWLPDTYPAPHFAASVFLGVFTTKSSVYAMYRALPEGVEATAFGEPITLLVAYMGGAMAVYGVILALLQHDMRALLSYHIQAQVGYMLVGIGLGLYLGGEALAAGVGGGFAHAFNNVLFKALLFMACGVVIYRTGINDLYDLGGLWRQMPIAAAGFALGALSITAIPGFNGFISKGLIFDTANPGSAYVDGGVTIVYWLLFIGAIGTFLSFIKLGYYVFLHGEWDGPELKDARPGHTVAMLSVGGLCVLFGVWWQGLLTLIPFGETAVVGDPTAMQLAQPFSPAHLQDAVILAVISVVSFPVVRRILYAVGDVHDPARVVEPLTYYSGKAGVYGVTGSFAAIDRAGIRFVRAWYWLGENPALAVTLAARRLPEPVRPGIADQQPPADGGVPSRLHIRAGIGTTVLVLTLVLTLMLVLVL